MRQLLLLLFFIGIFSCSKYYRFDEAYDKKDFLKAYNLLEQIEDKKSIYYKIREYRIVIRLALEGDKDFIEKLSNLVSFDVGYKLVDYRTFGIAYLSYINARSPEDYSNTLELFNKVANVPEEFESQYYLMRGITEYKLSKYEEAITDLKKSFRISSSVDAIYFIGLSLFNQGKVKEAKSYFEKILSITLDDFFISLAYFQLGEISYESGEYEKALDYYTRAIENFSEVPEYCFKMAKSLQKLGYSGLSAKYLRAALRIDKDYATAWFYLNIR